MTNRAIIQEHNTAGNNHWIFLLVGDSNNKCIYKERFKDTRLLEDTECWTVEIKDPSSVNEVYVNLISEQWVGLDVHSSIKLQQPRQTIPLEAKNTIGKYLKKQGLNNGSLSSILPTSQTLKRVKSSIVDQIKEMSEKRLGNTLSMTPTKLTLDKFAYTPAKRTKLLPCLEEEPKSTDEQTDDLPQFNNPDRHPMEQMNPEIYSRHVEPKLTTDEETHCLHRPSSPGQDANQLKTLLQYRSTNCCKDPEMQLNQSRITKCNADQKQHNTLKLQDGRSCQSAATEHITLLTAQTASEYKVHRTQETNSKAGLMKLSQNETSCNDFKLIKPSTSKSTEGHHTPFKGNIELYEGSTLEDEHFEEKINNNLVSRPTTALKSSSGEECLETDKSVIFNSQLPNSSSSHDSLMEQDNSEESKTKERDFQNGNASKFQNVMKPALAPTPDAHCSLHRKYLKTEMFQANAPTSDKDVALQNNEVQLSSDRESRQLEFQDKIRKHGPAIMSDNRSGHSNDPSVNRENTDRNMKQNAHSLNTKERKRLLFQKTLPKHYYPVFMKSLQPDITGPTELHSTGCDHLNEPSNEVAPSFLMKEKVSFNGILPESRKETAGCDDGTSAADSENVTKRVKELQPLPEEEVNFSNTVQIENEASVLKLCKSQHGSEGSRTSENRSQVHEDSGENEKTDGNLN
jgi:hypothetical protein